MKTLKKFKPKNKYNFKTLSIFAALFVVIGVATLLLTHAATPVIVDNSIPIPTNVKTFGDDANIIVTWTRPQNAPADLVGYYLTYKKQGSSTIAGTKQTIHESTQLQPLENGVTYDITVQSVRGSILETDKGDIVNHDSFSPMYWVRAEGHVSPTVSVTGTTSTARVDSMRQRLTGFFDDFTRPAGAMDELKWNNAATCDKPDSAGAFVNNQNHAHNSISCGFGAAVARPRATFDTSTATETNPAQVEFDMDMIYDGRSHWYLDFLPLSARTSKYPMDTNSHFFPDSVDDHADPTNMLRFDIPGHGYGMGLEYWDSAHNVQTLNSALRPTACNSSGTGGFIDYRYGCDMTKKTLNQSPLPEPVINPQRGPQNVRQHFVLQFTPTKVRLFLNSTLMLDSDLPAAWSAEKQYTLQNTQFSYNTGKQFAPSKDEFARKGVIPYFNFYHWDNLGFTGPAPSTVVHNYIEGGTDGKTPNYLDNIYTNITTQTRRTSTIPIPDDIGSPASAKLFFTLRSWQGSYIWSPNDNIVINGKTYPMPDLMAAIKEPPSYFSTTGISGSSIPLAININLADLKKGSNTVTFNLGDFGYTSNNHIELAYNKSGAIPTYTQPFGIYGHTLYDIIEPQMTQCDNYIYVEQDMGLPTSSGTNIRPGPCAFITTSHVTDGGGGTTTPPPSDTTSPTVSLTAPAANASLSGTASAFTATATDNTAITKVDFFVDGALLSSDTSSPYATTIDTTKLNNGGHSLTAKAYDAAGNVGTSAAVSVTVNNVVTPPLSLPAGTYDDPSASYDSNWTHGTLGSNPNQYQGGDSYTSVSGATATIAFTGTKIEVYGAKDTTHGQASYSIDGGTPVTVDYFASSRQDQVSMFSTAQLPNITHTLVIKELSTRNVSSSGNWITIDKFIVSNATTPPPIAKKCDFTADNIVDVKDLSILLTNFGMVVATGTKGDCGGSGDGKVDVFDLSVLLGVFGK